MAYSKSEDYPLLCQNGSLSPGHPTLIKDVFDERINPISDFWGCSMIPSYCYDELIMFRLVSYGVYIGLVEFIHNLLLRFGVWRMIFQAAEYNGLLADLRCTLCGETPRSTKGHLL